MPNELIPVRKSHVLGQSGVGAIVRGADGLAVVQDTRQWCNQQGHPGGEPFPYVERVRAVLGISQALREPPVARELANKQVDGVCVPATRFPSWMRCPNCSALYLRPWRDHQNNDLPHCARNECNGKPRLEQVTWVIAHPAGYLADVPWFFLAHRNTHAPDQQNCKKRDRLHLFERGYEKRILHCAACKAETLFRGDEQLPFDQERMQPWTRDDIVPPHVAQLEDVDGVGQKLAQVLTINDARIYTPIAVSVLIIPPESRVRKGTVVDLLYRNSDARRRLDNARTPLARNAVRQRLATEYRCQLQDIDAALGDLAGGYPLYGENLTPGQLRESEFKAFMEVLPDQRDDEDLVTRNYSSDWHALNGLKDLSVASRTIIGCVEHLVRVDRLKAVKVFKGFTRMGGKDIVPPDIVGQSGWLPAIELYGEGIFIALNEVRLQRWEHHPAVHARLQRMQSRFAQSGADAPSTLTPRFMLLHTLSHLLMREIESAGGYPAASLIERIYSSHSPERMAGILIHVAVPDIAGSLGGLAELAVPKRFLGILTRALDHSRWCSLDPVCSEHDGQGPGLLNRAACHACALVPETACEYRNTLLDRCFVKGDDIDELPAFFGAL